MLYNNTLHLKTPPINCSRQEKDETNLESMHSDIEKIIEESTAIDLNGFDNLDMVISAVIKM